MYKFDFKNFKVNNKRIVKNKVGVPDETSGSNGACLCWERGGILVQGVFKDLIDEVAIFKCRAIHWHAQRCLLPKFFRVPRFRCIYQVQTDDKVGILFFKDVSSLAVGTTEGSSSNIYQSPLPLYQYSDCLIRVPNLCPSFSISKRWANWRVGIGQIESVVFILTVDDSHFSSP